MGHALREIWRVLKQNGHLIDIRPITSKPPLDVISEMGVQTAGLIDDEAGRPDDRAANQAIAQGVSRGDYAKESEDTFEFPYYWDTLEQMRAYVEERWSDFSHLPQATLDNANRLIREDKGQARICIRVTMLFSLYKKVSQT